MADGKGAAGVCMGYLSEGDEGLYIADEVDVWFVGCMEVEHLHLWPF